MNIKTNQQENNPIATSVIVYIKDQKQPAKKKQSNFLIRSINMLEQCYLWPLISHCRRVRSRTNLSRSSAIRSISTLILCSSKARVRSM